MKKRIYALTLVVCLVLNMVSGIAFAEGEDETHNHTPGEWVVVTEPTCTSKGQKARYCTIEDCGALVETREIDMVAHVEGTQECADDYLEPTCTEKGHDWTHCSECHNLIKKIDGEWTIVTAEDCEIPAKGHEWETVAAKDPSCTEDGNNEYVCCSVCGAIDPEHPMEPYPATGHGELIANPHSSYEPTCNATAEPPYDEIDSSVPAICSVCGAEVKETISIEVKHQWEDEEGTEPTCTEPGYTAHQVCSACGRIQGKEEIEPKGHDFTKWLGALAGSCTEDGRLAGLVCSRCGTPDPDNPPEVLPAPGHTEEIIPGEAPTCTETGLTEGKKCSVCDEILVAQEEIPATGHSYKIVPGKKATCTEDGEGAYKLCTVCGDKVYLDPSKAIIPAHGHSNEDGYYPEDGNETPGEERFHETDEYEDYVISEEEAAKAKFATCEENGYQPEAHCAFCDAILVEGEEVPATDHHWELKVAGTMPTCDTDGVSDLWYCTNVDENTGEPCPETRGGEVINAIAHKGHMKPVAQTLSTCTTPGNFAYDYCELCGFATNEAYLEEINGRWIQIYSDPKIDDYLQKVQDGIAVETPFGATLPKTETEMPEKGHPSKFVLQTYHSPVTGRSYIVEDVKPLEPTCTENGIAEGATRCVVCGEYYDLQVIPAYNHADLCWVGGVEATCTEDGHEPFVFCLICGKAVKDDFGDIDDETPVRAALSASDITVEGDAAKFEIPEEFVIGKLGHDEQPGVALEPTCIEKGHTAGTYCARCLMTLTEQEEIDALDHDLQLTEEEIPATCTEDGKTAVYECGRDGCDYTEGGEAIPATGHDSGRVTAEKAPTCSEYGFGQGLHCSKCAVDYEPVKDYLLDNGVVDAEDLYEAGWLIVPQMIAPLGHNIALYDGEEPDCLNDGVKEHYFCNRCWHAVAAEDLPSDPTDEQIADALTESDIIIDEETWEVPEAFIIPALGHDWLKVPGGEKTAPTCTKAGTDGLQQCQRCDVIEAKIVPALGHDWEIVEEKEATCAEAGSHEHKLCTRGDAFSVELGNGMWAVVSMDKYEAIYNQYILIPKNTEHDDLKHVDALMATCTTPGHTAGQYCSVCGYEGFDEIEPDAEAYHTYLTDNKDALLEDGPLTWTITNPGNGKPGSGMEAILCPEGCGYIIDVRLYPEVLKGDVNMDGKVNSVDALMILQYKAGVIATLPNMVAADYNEDDNINSVDALGILNSKIN